MSDATATAFPISETAIRKTPPTAATGPVLIGDILNERAGQPELLRLWAIWERQVKEDSSPEE